MSKNTYLHNVYIDNSGSMGEMDKINIAIYLARSIKNASFYLLNGQEVDLNSASLPLSNDKSLNIKSDKITILLSDGLFNLDKKIFDIALGVGIDADIEALQKIAKYAYSMNDILSFLEHVNSLLTMDDESDSWD